MLVITIKLGTKSCKLTLQTHHEFCHKKQEFMMFVSSKSLPEKDFPSAYLLSSHGYFPSALILSREGHAKEFGYQAFKQFEEIEDYNKDCVFFENVIHSLYISEVC